MNARLMPLTVDRDYLLSHANSPEQTMVQSYATVIGNFCDPHGAIFVPALGLDLPVFRGLLATFFPRMIAPRHWLLAQIAKPSDDGALAEFPDLLQLLLEHRALPDEHHLCAAHLVATACMGNDHLWQDAGMPNRQGISALLHECFPRLAGRNTGEMKWKKFLYKQLCDREEIRVCKAPSCAACDDYKQCFGAEA